MLHNTINLLTTAGELLITMTWPLTSQLCSWSGNQVNSRVYTIMACRCSTPKRPSALDATCSFSELTRSIEKQKTYFSIPVGTFWQTKCVNSSREPGTAAKRSTASTLTTSFDMYHILCGIYCCFLLSTSVIFLLKDCDRL